MKSSKMTAAATLCLALGCSGSLFAQQPAQLSLQPVQLPVQQPAQYPAQDHALQPALQPVQQPIVPLTLNDAIKLAFDRNLDLKVELFNPALAEADIQHSLGIYDPLLTAGLSYNRSTSPNTFDFTPFTVDQFSASAAVSQLLPTGGTIGATANSGWVSNSPSYYSNNINFTVSQPLLRNFGRESTELNIAVSRVAKEGSVERFRTRLSDTVAQVRNDYFQLYNLREALEVKKTSLALARKILDETRGRVRAGVLPAMEILNAEFGAATQEKAVIDAERAVRDQMDVLRLELQLGSAGDIVLLDQPTTQSYAVLEDQELALAINNRPELAAQRSTIKIDDLQQRVAKNRTLPDLTVNANFGLGGFDPRFPNSLEKTANASDPNWGVGLSFSYPLGNRAARNDYIKSRLTKEQAQTQLQSLEAGIAKDVKTSIRLLASSYKQLDVTTRGRAYAEDRMRAFEKKNAVGLATTKDVIDALNDLVTAKGNQIQAVVDYNNAITQLWHVTGELLDRQGIKVTENQADPLYQRDK
jgi:outer membrane protein